MKILTVCGMGSGSSLILKMNTDEIISKLGIDASVEACDLGSSGGSHADLIISTKELGVQLADLEVPKILLNNIIDISKLEEELTVFFKGK